MTEGGDPDNLPVPNAATAQLVWVSAFSHKHIGSLA